MEILKKFKLKEIKKETWKMLAIATGSLFIGGYVVLKSGLLKKFEA